MHICSLLHSPRTNTLSCIASAMATAWTTMRRRGRRKAVRRTSAPTKPRSWSVWRPNCTTSRDMLRRSRWRRREYTRSNPDLCLCLLQLHRMLTNSVLSLKMHEQRKTKQKTEDKTPEGAVPAYLLDREGQSRAKVLSNMIKQKRKEKAVSIGLSVGV